MGEAGVPSVVATKLSVPVVRAQTIARDRLTRLLEDGGEVPLTVVCAPAGFGKTTALAEWLNDTERACAWVSLDEQDNDSRRLLAHLLSGLDRLWPAALVEAETALRGGSDLLETVVPAIAGVLADRLEDDRGLAIVFDDYQEVTEAECHRLLIALIDALPLGVRVIVGSRTPPPVRLARRRVTGTVHEVGPEKLAFQGAEAELLLNGTLGLGLGSDQVAAIDRHVRGWPAGLALVASSLPAAPARDEFLAAFAQSEDAVAEHPDRPRDHVRVDQRRSRGAAPRVPAVELRQDPRPRPGLSAAWRHTARGGQAAAPPGICARAPR